MIGVYVINAIRKNFCQWIIFRTLAAPCHQLIKYQNYICSEMYSNAMYYTMLTPSYLPLPYAPFQMKILLCWLPLYFEHIIRFGFAVIVVCCSMQGNFGLRMCLCVCICVLTLYFTHRHGECSDITSRK